MVKSTSRNAKISPDPQLTKRAAHVRSVECASGTTVSLVGFMGAGKTTVGHALAERLDWRFDDLDDIIEAREAQTIEQIFQLRGELGFRKIEGSALRETVAGNQSFRVLALGGGTFIHAENRSLLIAAGIPSVFLDASPNELFDRCEKPGAVRPLRRNREQFYALYAERRSGYLNADLCVQTSGKEVAVVVQEIVSKLNLRPFQGDFE